ncbi:MAG: VLRF1 family aeRF1-type release factor [Solirubrobacterales bacterium]
MTDLAPESLTPDALLELSRRTDPVGVLSIYVDADSGVDPGLRGAAIDIDNRLAELQRRTEDQGPPELARAVEDGIRRVRPQIHRLTDPALSGRGRALFCALSDGQTTGFSSQMRLAHRVVLAAGAFIHPLLELADEGRPAGVVLASQDGARLLDWRLDELREVARLEPEVVQAPHERAGPLGSTVASRQGSPKREQRAARERDRLSRFLAAVAAAVESHLPEHGWERVLVSGGDRLTEPLADALPALRERIVRDPRLLAQLAPAELAAAVSERLRSDHRARELDLLGRTREAAAARGVSEVAAALNEGRVTHLIYDPEVRYEGTIDADGALYAAGEAPPAARELTDEPRLTERLVERALGTGARVSPVEGAAAGALAEAGGIVALLRW